MYYVLLLLLLWSIIDVKACPIFRDFPIHLDPKELPHPLLKTLDTALEIVIIMVHAVAGQGCVLVKWLKVLTATKILIYNHSMKKIW